MKSKTAPQISTLSDVLAEVHSWVTAKYGSAESADYSLPEYPGWDELSSAFIDALRCKPAEQWSKRECAVFHEAVLMDWQWHLLLKNMTLSEFIPIAMASYPVRILTVYLLVQARRISDVATLQRIALHHFETNPDANLRLEAFQMLARSKWNQTEKYAQLFWNSGDLIQQIAALQALESYKSDLLPRYLELADLTLDPSLTRIAGATRTIAALKKHKTGAPDEQHEF
jgi:hypothetical protein